MILERFNALVFVGDDIAQSVYTAFNILLREDLALGGLQNWIMNEEDKERCKCDSQLTDAGCDRFRVRRMEEVVKNQGGGRKGSGYACERGCPHPG